MKTKNPKNVGEVFDLLLRGERHAEVRMALKTLAQECTFMELSLWRLWLQNDPVTPLEVARMRAAHDAEQIEHDRAFHAAVAKATAKGKQHVKRTWAKWEKLPPMKLPDALTAFGIQGASRTIAGTLAPTAKSYVHDATDNYVKMRYPKDRWAILFGRKALPSPNALRIIFRERAIRVVRHPDNPNWYRLRLNLWREGPPVEVDVKVKSKSRYTQEWLAELADSREFPSGGMLSLRRKKGRDTWQISLSRVRRSGERRTVTDAEPGRTLVVYAPRDQEVFLWCEVSPRPGPVPWRKSVESTDIVRFKQRAQQRRQELGRQYAQSPGGSRHGRGRARALAPTEPWRDGYERRVKTWIEQRSAAIVQNALDMRCAAIQVEDLSERDPHLLALGSFPYYRLVLRIRQKAETAGLKWLGTFNFDAVEAMLTAAVAEG